MTNSDADAAKSDSAEYDDKPEDPEATPPSRRRQLLGSAPVWMSAIGGLLAGLVPLLLFLMDSDAISASTPTTATITTGATSTEYITVSSSISATSAAPTKSTDTTTNSRPASSNPTSPITNAPTVATSAPTTAGSNPATNPSGAGIRYSGVLTFGSYNLDITPPRDIAAVNVWQMPQNRLHGDENYQLVEWIGDSAPGQAECADDLAKRAQRDAENLIVGSRVCGKTPSGRIFRIDVVGINDTTISGQVTVWE